MKPIVTYRCGLCIDKKANRLAVIALVDGRALLLHDARNSDFRDPSRVTDGGRWAAPAT